MDNDSDSSKSDTGEGFEAQQIEIQKEQLLNNDPDLYKDDAIDILDDLRPKDFLPRSIYKEVGLKQCQHNSDNSIHTFSETHCLTPIPPETTKCKKYHSLADRYSESASTLVYRKFKEVNTEDFLHSYTRLDKLVDYSLINFTEFQQTGQPQELFDSNFQNGNLLYAYMVSPSEYDLVLQNDTNTRGYNQWFYFSFEFKQAKEVTFNVVNMIKKKTLFHKGVKPCFFVADGSNSWNQVSSSVRYFKNSVQRETGDSYYTLSYKYRADKSCRVYFSLNLPYTYTKLISFLKQVQQTNSGQITIEKTTLCYTLSNNAVPCLRFKSPNHQPERRILFFARQHPGQSISSHVMESLIKTLIRRHRILQKFQVICVPMLNVDGVIYGNFRTNLAGYDINRQWKQTDKVLLPEVYAMKRLIAKTPSLQFVLDLHGHSKKFNSFIYACNQENKFQEKLFPYLMSKNSLFKIQSCTYGLTKDKENTARAFVKQMGIQHIYTLETSFYGYGTEGNYRRFESKHFDSLGLTIIDSLEELYFSKAEQLLKYQPEINRVIQRYEGDHQERSADSGSDSNPSEDELSNIERDSYVIPASLLKDRASRMPQRQTRCEKKQPKTIRVHQRRQKSFQGSNREIYTSQKSQFRRTYEAPPRVSNPKTSKATSRKASQEKPNKTVSKLVVSESRQIQNSKLNKTIAFKPKSKEIKSLAPIKKQEKEKEVVSNLFTSSFKRNNPKPKRVNRSLVEEKKPQKSGEQDQLINVFQKESLKQEQQLSTMMAQMKNNLRQLNKLDRIVEERIREKMTHSLLSNMCHMRRSQHNPGTVETESNLLEAGLRQRLGNTVTLDPTKQEDTQKQGRHRSRKSRNLNQTKKQMVFLSQLMRPKVQTGKNYQIQVIGSNSNKPKQMLYFNQYL